MLLFIPSTNPSVKVMSSLATWMQAQGMATALVANPQQQGFLRSVGKRTHAILDFKTLQPVHVDVVPAALDATKAGPVAGSTPAKRAGKLQALHQVNNTFAIALVAAYWLLQILRFRLLWRKQVRALSCRVAFVWGDNAGTTNGELLNLLKANGATLVHLPVSLSDQNIIARLRAGSDVCRLTKRSPILSRLLARCFREQGFDFEGGRVLYYHPGEAWAMALLGVLPLRPWILGGSRADYVCLADKAQCDYWLQRGMPAEKVRVTGNLDMQDAASDMIRLRNSHAALLAQDKRLVLINMPNLVEHSVMSNWDQFWGDVRKILAPCARPDAQIVINLHPKSEECNYAWLEKAYGCLVTKGDIGAWIGLADLYISACSTTELIARELGVPVVDIGAIYMFESEVLRSVPNIRFVSDYDDYEHAVSSVLELPLKQAARFRSVQGIERVGVVSPYQRLKDVLVMEILGKE